jgi:hypothetical protein
MIRRGLVLIAYWMSRDIMVYIASAAVGSEVEVEVGMVW